MSKTVKESTDPVPQDTRYPVPIPEHMENPRDRAKMDYYNNPSIADYIAPMKVAPELLGLAPLLNPFAQFTSAQRGMMFTSHLAQLQVIRGGNHHRIFTGYENIVGKYEFNTTERNQDIQILETIPRFVPHSGVYPIKDNPYYIIIYRGVEDNKVGYFQLNKHTIRSDGYGYKNKWLNSRLLNKGNFIPKEVPLCTSPIHEGNEYRFGVDLNTVYMADPNCTEDAFVISESAAEKLTTMAYGRMSFKILPNQIPVNLYGSDDEYKFMPDIGECVRDDGIFCALRTPNQDSVLFDMSKENLTKVQYLHDSIFYLPKGAQITNIDVVVNRKCKVKTPREVFSQVQKYRDPINAHNIRIWEAYQQAVNEGKEIDPAFNTLVTRSISNLLADNVRIPGYTKKADITLVKKKEAIEFIYITVEYCYLNRPHKGSKLTGCHGNFISKD